MLRRLLRDARGSVALIFALAMPVFITGLAMSVDFVLWIKQRSEMQGVADTAVLSAAQSYGEAGNLTAAQSAANNVITAHGLHMMTANTQLTGGGSGVEVTLSHPGKAYFSGALPMSPPVIKVRSVAMVAEQGSDACLLALDPSASQSIWLDSNAEINAPNCTVHADSAHSRAFDAYSNSKITAGEICAVGGYGGGSSHYNPTPTTSCPFIADPLAGVSAPNTAGCDHSGHEIDGEEDDPVTLGPGVYCGGLTIKGDSVVSFDPGTYVIKNGEFFVDSNSRISGTGVTFYFTGSDATIFFDSNVQVDFTAPTTGPQQGIIFFEDRSAPLLREHRLFSNNISRLEGAVYLSRGLLWLDSNSQIAANSNFTSIIVRRLRLDSNAQLVLNADYDDSSVPAVAISSGDAVLRIAE